MNNVRPTEELNQVLVHEYDTLVPVVASIARVPPEHAREAIHGAARRMLEAMQRQPSTYCVLSPRSFLLRSALNELWMESRRIGREIPFSQLAPEERRELFAIADPRPTPCEQVEQRETNEILWEEVAILSPREAAVLTRWAHGSSFGETAAELGIKPSTVRELWSRGIRHLRARPRVQQLAA